MRPVALSIPGNDALMSFINFAPSPKYHDDDRRLRMFDEVVKASPAAGRLAVPSVELPPKAPLPWTSTSHRELDAPPRAAWACAGDLLMNAANTPSNGRNARGRLM